MRQKTWFYCIFYIRKNLLCCCDRYLLKSFRFLIISFLHRLYIKLLRKDYVTGTFVQCNYAVLSVQQLKIDTKKVMF